MRRSTDRPPNLISGPEETARERETRVLTMLRDLAGAARLRMATARIADGATSLLTKAANRYRRPR